MKKKIPMILLLSLLAPLSSCDALKNVEITAGEFPKGGKEITYLQLKEALDDKEIEEKIIPNGVKTSLTSDTISFYHMKDFSDELSEDLTASVTVSNFNFDLQVNGLVNAKSVNELTMKAGLSANIKTDLESFDSTLPTESQEGYNVDIKSYLTNSRMYFELDKQVANALSVAISPDKEIDLSKFYFDAGLFVKEDMFPLIDEEKLEDGILNIYETEYESLGIKIPELTEEQQDLFFTILCEEFLTLKEYRDGYLAVLNKTGEEFVQSIEKTYSRLYNQGLLSVIYDEEITLEKFNEYLNEMRSDLKSLKQDLRTCKLSLKLGENGSMEYAVDFLYENIQSASSEVYSPYVSTTRLDVDFKVKVDFFEELEIELPEFDNTYKNLLSYIQ